MKNLILHYLAIFLPAILLIAFWKPMIPEVALTLLFIYGFIYRTWLDGNRLFLKGWSLKKTYGKSPTAAPE